MNAIRRNIETAVLKDLEKKFVFIAGPRQVGKTTLAKRIILERSGNYLNYDADEDRASILKKEYIRHHWVCLDEFHKFQRWKAHLKGVYDKYHENMHLILTGSARLDIFQRSGDSLFGRYFLHHLHPLTLGEINSSGLPPLLRDPMEAGPDIPGLESLLRFGGFPEPFESQSEKEHLRWTLARRHLLIREDLRDLTQIQLLTLAEHLMILLPERIGSLFSYKSIAEDLKVSAPTAKKWMESFEKLYIAYKLTPYSRNVVRGIQRQPKYYLYDWSQIASPGHRFENLVASHLWKAVQVWMDQGEAELDLHFIRDRDRREVDFLVSRNKRPWFLVECKTQSLQLSPILSYFSKKLGIPAIQLLEIKDVERREQNCLIISANRWLSQLP